MVYRKKIEVTHTFNHPDVIRFTLSVLQTWQKDDRPVLFVPCSKRKPIQNSLTHRVMFHRFRDRCNLVIIAEPMTIIPYDRWDYPEYEYPPSALWRIEGESLRFRHRLVMFLRRHRLNESSSFFLLPHHHLLVLWKAWEAAFGDVSNLHGYGYTHATRWFFIKKLDEDIRVHVGA
jgi:hypothetical protein